MARPSGDDRGARRGSRRRSVAGARSWNFSRPRSPRLGEPERCANISRKPRRKVRQWPQEGSEIDPLAASFFSSREPSHHRGHHGAGSAVLLRGQHKTRSPDRCPMCGCGVDPARSKCSSSRRVWKARLPIFRATVSRANLEVACGAQSLRSTQENR
jgi:hypothetical protein